MPITYTETRSNYVTYALSSGRKFKTSYGIIGIDPTCQPIHGGYQGSLESTDDWTPAERAELARMMIERWAKFGDLRLGSIEDDNPSVGGQHISEPEYPKSTDPDGFDPAPHP